MKQKYMNYYSNCLLVFFLIQIIIINFTTCNRNKQIKNETNLQKQQIHFLKKYPTDDQTAQKIRNNIFEYAKVIMRKSNSRTIRNKQIMNGSLPNSFPKQMVNKANKLRSNKKNFLNIMSNPTELWEICIHPKYKVNSIEWCKQIYGVNDTEKVEECRNSFCTVCCDHLPKMLKQIANNNALGKLLMFDKKSGYQRIMKILDSTDIDKCRAQCKENYPIQMPVILPSPPRDVNLGKTAENSAKSCSDIKKWGDMDSKTGEYWIELGSHGKVKAFCDMDVDDGGWTLFFNYVHKPSQEIFIDSSKLPKNLSYNSHMNFRDTGFSGKDIKEIRFLCTEKNINKLYMHFKISSDEIIQTAFSGNQVYLSLATFSNNDSLFTDLRFPGNVQSWIRVINKNNVNKFDYVGSSKNGNFWDTPFGSNKIKKFWTVKPGRFECGSYHRDNLNSNEANLIGTHHSIWFRGPAINDEDARIRYNSRNYK